ncbi:MAG TPA: hypothetical protein VHZ55_32365 [Bryobacteraceae bacterium]|nr:hypothetical protein [Bryobacteraceae bacterium]
MAARIGEHEESGISIRAYCEQRGIAEHAFCGWRQSLRADQQVSFASVKTKPTIERAQVIG